MMGVQGGMQTPWVTLFFPAQTRQIATQQNFELHMLHLTPHPLSWRQLHGDITSNSKGPTGHADSRKR